MKRHIVLLLPLLLLGCSKQESETERRANIRPSPNLPFQITVVETPESKEQKAIGAHTTALLAAKAYDDLDRLEIKYCSSRESYADGTWKLSVLYNAIAFPDASSDADWEARQQEIQNWMDARPMSVTARIAMALFLRNYAWKARGGDWANTVTTDGWRLFSERLHNAYKVLNDAKYLEHDDPVYWSTVLKIALGLQAPRAAYDVIFKEALACRMRYDPFYRERAVYL